jgi:hypothetical protein
LALALFAVTLFISAFILFLVQPIIGKTILPKLGGTPQVWNTCMVFFQSVLLLGYFYTHAASTRLSLRWQLIIHCLLLFVPFLFLLPLSYLLFGGDFSGPFDITKWIPTLGANPIVSTLTILFIVVGIPFFVVSTSAPLLQKWFGSTGHPAAKDPYFLYGASNLGSMLSLVLYPILIEPFMDLTPQKWLWTGSYVLLVVSVLACAAMIWSAGGTKRVRYAGGNTPVEPGSEGQPVPPPVLETAPARTGTASTAVTTAPAATAARSTAFKKGKPHHRPREAPAAAESPSIRTASDEMTVWRRLRWIGLAAVPSSLMLGVTTHITTDLSPIPLFWLVPLTIYLASFILVFSKWPVVWTEGPHTFMLYLQPAIIALMVFIDIVPFGAASIWLPIFANVVGFAATALVCHGELAKDRPSTKHLTEFYLLMSVGGMLGGVFNGIIAPLFFKYVLEFSIAVICACLLRPKMKESGWTDDLFASITETPAATDHAPPHRGSKGQPAPRASARAAASPATTRFMDVVLPIAIVVFAAVLWTVARPVRGDTEATRGFKYFAIFGVPLICAAFYYGRPLRFGLGIAGIIILHGFLTAENNLYAGRSYFGILKVRMVEGEDDPRNEIDTPFTQLMHGSTHHGMNIFKPDNKADWGKPDKDFSRLATTYYHRYGPAGIVMEKFNWFPGPQNTYWADARMPATLVGQAVPSLGTGPFCQLVDLWSEPPFATIGLGTGTMASYGRPYQHVHYYEIDNLIRKLSLPVGPKDYYYAYNNFPRDDIPFTFSEYRNSQNKPRIHFNSLRDAVLRGSEVQVFMGDARLRMNLPYENFHAKDKDGVPLEFSKVPPGGPRSFYHMMVIDAFSSDAIPVHLITKEAIEMYFEHLTEEGILCVHTSNRHVDLPLVVAAVGSNLGYSYLRGHDATPARVLASLNKTRAPFKELGRFTSEWVMVARKPEYLKHLTDPPNYMKEMDELQAAFPKQAGGGAYWTTPEAHKKYLWTDDHSNLWNVLRSR